MVYSIYLNLVDTRDIYRDLTMKELSYKLSHHQKLRLTLEDCAMCLKNHEDPYLSSAALSSRKRISRHQFDPDTEHELPVDEISQCGNVSNNKKVDKVPLKNKKLSLVTKDVIIRAQAEQIYREVLPISSTSTVKSTATEAWLTDHFEYQPHASVARGDIYSYYLRHCDEVKQTPYNPAHFGKIVRTAFPNVKTRRIGVRGRSKYHYYGIAPKRGDKGPLAPVITGRNNQSIAYETILDQNNKKKPFMENDAAGIIPTTYHLENECCTGVVGGWFDSSHVILCMNKYTERDKREILALLDSFPTVNDCLGLPLYLTGKMEEFLVLYKQHSVQMLHCILMADFYEVRDVVVDFWRNLPVPFLSCALMTQPEVIQTIFTCDLMTYIAMINILLPDPTKSMPSGLMQFLRTFVDNLDFWIAEGMHMYPKPLRDHKFKACQQFQSYMKSCLELSHIAAAAADIVHNSDLVSCLQMDLQDLDIADLSQHCRMNNNSCCVEDVEDTLRHYLGKFQQLLINNSILEDYIAWIETIVKDRLNGNTTDSDVSATEVSRELMLQWSYISSQILLQLTTLSAPSIGSFHLLDILFKDYAIFFFRKIYKA